MITEMEVQHARRAFAEAQALLRGVATRSLGEIAVGWHGAAAHPEVGAFAVVRDGGPFDDELIGDVLRLTVAGREAFVYCVGGADVPTDLSLSRPAFLRLDWLTRESTRAIVEVVR